MWTTLDDWAFGYTGIVRPSSADGNEIRERQDRDDDVDADDDDDDGGGGDRTDIIARTSGGKLSAPS